MPTGNTKPCWIDRVMEMSAEFDELRLPDVHADIAQDREWCEVTIGEETRRVRFHDYHELYRVPGLYEAVFYEHLDCCSPSRVVHLLQGIMEDLGQCPSKLRVLDVGAGNGMVGDELRAIGVQQTVAIDIIDEARKAALRDRPGVYDEYVVADLTDLPEVQEEGLRRQRLNCLTAVAALGFGDIPPAALLKAMDLIDTPGWLAFNIKEAFLCERDDTGFCKLIRQLCREEVIQIQAYWRYRHRLSTSGRPLYYVAMIARKLRDLPDHVVQAWEPAGEDGRD